MAHETQMEMKELIIAITLVCADGLQVNTPARAPAHRTGSE